MKKLIAIFLVLFCTSAGSAGNHNVGWQQIRSVTAVDNPYLAVATYDGKPSYAIDIANSQIRYVQLIIAGTGAENAQIITIVWAGRGQFGPAVPVANITWYLGTMQVRKDPQTHAATTLQYYADIAQVTSYWPIDVFSPNNGNNTLATVTFDSLDCDWIAVEILYMNSASKVNVYMTYFGGQ